MVNDPNEVPSVPVTTAEAQAQSAPVQGVDAAALAQADALAVATEAALAQSPDAPVDAPVSALSDGQPDERALDNRYVIQPGDSLESISVAHYGDDSHVADILAANSSVLGSDPGVVQVGVAIVLP